LTSGSLDDWVLVNSLGSKYKIVGSFEQSHLTVTSSVVFPGGQLTQPKDEPFRININLNNWFTVNLPQKSMTFAFNDFPLKAPRFAIFPNTFKSCAEFDAVNGYLACYLECKAAKVTMLLSADLTGFLLRQLNYMKATSLILPLLDSETFSTELSSRENYPFFLRPLNGARYIWLHFSLMFKRLKYDTINFFISKDIEEDVLQFFKDINIKLVTPLDLYIIDTADTARIKRGAQFVKDSMIRPVLISGFPREAVLMLTALHDVGVRREDVVVFGHMLVFDFVLLNTPDEDKFKILEFETSWVGCDWALYIGEAGARLKQTFMADLGYANYSECFSYDLAHLVTNAIDFAIKRGLDFFNWEEMIFAMRSQKLVGCSGTTIFSNENNDRLNNDFYLAQVRQEDGKYFETPVLITSTAGQAYLPIEDFVWYDSSNNTPRQSRLTYKSCPFPEEYRVESYDSQLLTVWINWGLVGFAAATAALTLAISCKQSPLAKLEEQIVMSTQDIIGYASSLIDLIAMDHLNPHYGVIKLVMHLGSISFFDTESLSGGNLFSFLNALYFVIGVSLTSSVLVVCRRFRNYKFDMHLVAFICTRTAFAPVAYFVMGTFDCSKAASASGNPDLTDSFVDNDCNENCWTGKHQVYAVSSTVLVAAYLLTSTPISSALSASLQGLQFEFSRTYLSLRQLVLMILIANDKSSLVVSSLVRSVLYTAVLVVYFGLCLRWSVLNMPRLNLLHNALLGYFIIVSLCELLYFEVLASVPLWASVGGVFILGGLGYTGYRHYKLPNMLRVPFPIDEVAVFNFAFRPNQPFRNRFVKTEKITPKNEAQTTVHRPGQPIKPQ
jgi:hypothetical protein